MKYLIYALAIITLVGGIYVWDATYRYELYSSCKGERIIQTFYQTDNQQQAFSTHFDDKNWDFPQYSDIAKINVAKNTPVLGYLFSHNLSAEKRKKLLAFFRNPNHFTWQKKDLKASEYDIQIRFYDSKNRQIGKIWLCTSCAMCKTVPFTPDVKFGNIKPESLEALMEIIR